MIKKKLQLNIESNNVYDSDIHSDKLKCHSDNIEEKINAENELKIFETTNDNITTRCDEYNDLITESGLYGSSGTIYEYDNKYIKISNLPLEISKLFNKHDIKCDTVKMKINKSLNENKNNILFSQLSNIYPLHIMKIYSTNQCKNSSGIFSNIMLMEKVSGITLTNYLKNINLNEVTNIRKLVCCLIQLIYITTYANLNGYVHNDLTTNNIMVYDLNEEYKLNGIKINNKNINIYFKNVDNIPTIKLIDFSYSTFIQQNRLNNKIIFGETVQVIKIIQNKLNFFKKNCIILKQINELIDHYIQNTELYFHMLEMDVDIYTSNGYRLLSDDKIINLSLSKDKLFNILNFYIDLMKIINIEFEKYFIIEIINNKYNFDTDIDIIYDKENIDNSNIRKKTNELYLKKYLKYKNKYIELKKNISNKNNIII